MIRALLLALAALTLAWTPYPVADRVNKEAIVVEVYDDYSLGLGCLFDYTRLLGNPFEPLSVLGTPECTIFMHDYCVIRTIPSDFLLGHAARHCWEGEYHVPIFPGLDLPPPSLRPPTDRGGLEGRQ